MIEALPHDMDVQVIRRPSSYCVLYMDLLHSQKLPVGSSQFRFSIVDNFGKDVNLVPDIVVTVPAPPLHGTLYKITVNSDMTMKSRLSVSRFNVKDILLGHIEYEFDNRSVFTREDTFNLTFRYGHSVVENITIHVCIDPVPIPDVVIIQPAFVSQKGLSNINSSHLSANDTRGSDQLVFVILRAPKYGSIVYQNDPSGNGLQNFTQDDLNSNRLRYMRFSSSSAPSDALLFKVCTEMSICTRALTLEMIIKLINLTIINPGIEVLEGSNYTFTTQTLSATSPPNYTDVSFYPLYEGKRPLHGELHLIHGDVATEVNPVRFYLGDIERGKLIYCNDGNEFLSDGFNLKVSAQSTKGKPSLVVTEFVQISIIPVNDNPPEFVNRPVGNILQVARGGSIQITTSLLSAHDYDSNIDDLDLIYVTLIDSPIYGYLYLDIDHNDKSLSLSNWTERDIRERKLYYKQTKADATRDLLVLELIDDPLNIRTDQMSEIFTIDILEVILKDNATSTSFLVTEGERRIITFEFLSYRAVNDDFLGNADIRYTVVDTPRQGVLELNNTRLLVDDYFTQQQIHDGLLVYVHDHSNNMTDHFDYTLQVPTRGSKPQKYSFTVSVDVIDDDPPTVDYIMDPVLVLERSVVRLNNSVILINDDDTIILSVDTDDIVCMLVNEPKKGLIQRRRSGSGWKVIYENDTFTKYDIIEGNLRYNNTILGDYSDHFRFTVTDGKNYRNNTFTVNIAILPTQLKIRVQSVLVDEDSSVFLEPEHFLVNHPYLETVPGTIHIVRSPRGGVIEDLVTSESIESSFTTEQLRNQSIKYVHLGGEDDMDSFSFTYESHDPAGFNRASVTKVFEITIIGINDQPPILDPNRKQRLELWAGETKELDETYLNVSDGDTPRHQLVYHLHPVGQEFDGYIAFKNETERAITTFTQEDVSQGRIVFVHVTDQEGHISYDVTDGEIVTRGQLSVDADPLLLGCNIEDCRWTSPSVSRGGRVQLTFDNLCCTTNDNENDRELQYHVLLKKYGIILVHSTPVDVFTKRQLEQGVVYYKHTDMDRWENTEVIDIQVRTDLDVSENVQLSIRLNLPHEPGRVAVNSGLRVNEGGTTCLSETLLDARNLRYFAWRDRELKRGPLGSLTITYELLKLPEHGQLFVNHLPLTSLSGTFTQEDISEEKVCYRHDDSETVIDQVFFSVHIGGETFSWGSQLRESLDILITPQNDIRPTLKTLVAGLQLVEGFSYTLTEDDLEIIDRDSEPSSILIFIHSVPENADIRLNQVVLKVGSNFSQSHISRGFVTLVPHLQMSSVTSMMRFYFTDLGEVVNDTYEFTVSIVPHSLNVLGTRRVTYQQNESSVKILKKSLYANTNGIKRETLFMVTRPPTDGELSMTSSQSPVSAFSQQDINQGRVWYMPRHDSINHIDSFLVDVVNRNLTVSDVVVEIHVLVWGRVERTQVDFSTVAGSDYLFKLPRNIIELNVENRHPKLLVLDPPKYGHLLLKIVHHQFSKRNTGKVSDPDSVHHILPRAAVQLTDVDNFSFHYDDIKNGWLFYSWDYKLPLDSEIITDNFTLLVNDSTMRPGEAFFELQIVPPVTPSTMTDTVSHNTVSSDPGAKPTASVSPHRDSGFPIFTLIPIVGVVCILVIMIVIVIVFCLTQQKRIRKKLQPTITPQSPQFPWSVSPSLSPPRPVVTQYTYDPSSLESDNDGHHSVSSGFSEGDEEVPPPLQSPTNSHAFSHSPPYTGTHSASPTYSSSPVQLPLSRHPRVRSNVSITFSGRQSELSQVSIDESLPPYGQPLVRGPTKFAVPLAVRPLSHMVGVSNGCGLDYNSPLDTDDNRLSSQLSSCNASEIDGQLPRAGKPDMEARVEDNGPDVTEENDNGLTYSLSVASGKVQEEDGEHFGSNASGLHTLLDLTDPDVQRLFKSSHPVLGKQEYWF